MAEDDLSEEETTQLPDLFASVIEQIQNGPDDMAIERSLADRTALLSLLSMIPSLLKCQESMA